MPHGGLALQLHVVFVAVDVEARLRGVVDAPDDDRGDLDRIAALVVNLEPLAVKVARAQRDLASRIEWIGAAQAGYASGAAVAAEELQDRRLLRLHRVETGEEQH